MTINLSEITFDNDFFETVMPNGKFIILNRINESIATSTRGDVAVKTINIAVASEEGEYDNCTSIIGMSCDYYELTSDHKEYEGSPLDEDNMAYCTVEVYE